ncbi:MAG: hybrid sensor histidine kinase/response regulator [Verrucomicrobiota bacterium]|nr:hybrid sensor histidine kinase/response regulator [Verrucomicrobiota bacterium]
MNLSDATLLIVDDTPANLSVLYDTLGSAGFRVLTAESGESALKRIQFVQPDLVLLDVMMPGMDGFETCRRLKALDSMRDTPIIFMTALSEADDKVRGLKAGAVDYITKPFQQEEVLARISIHLRLRRTQLELEAQIRERDALISELDAFAHTVAHDLRTPLNGIMGFSEIMQVSWHRLSEEEKLDSARYIHASGVRMNKIIDEIMLLASVRKQEVVLHTVMMEGVVSEAMERLKSFIKEKKASITLVGPWPDTVGYGPWIEEVWANFITNAIKYGGAPARIELGGCNAADPKYARFFVRDYGPGIEPEQQSRLFTPFTRLNTTGVSGHGLGLSIVQRVIDRLDGRVGVTSVPGNGSTFYFELPLLSSTL